MYSFKVKKRKEKKKKRKNKMKQNEKIHRTKYIIKTVLDTRKQSMKMF